MIHILTRKSLFRLIGLLFLPTIFISLPVAAGPAQVVTWKTQVKKTSHQEYDLIWKASIQPGWHLYSQFLSSDEGPVPTRFSFSDTTRFIRVGGVKELSPVERVHDSSFDMEVAYFSGEAEFVQHIRVLDNVKQVKGELEFMACDDSRCLPPATVPFQFNL